VGKYLNNGDFPGKALNDLVLVSKRSLALRSSVLSCFKLRQQRVFISTFLR